ncbi:hypothetical protein JAAARDRAFT_42428 [Jaapia argillacea MUCL 33604]|uniref:Uncharacterized protein n=1 Tax=Jaapia argillacea MUCL 33604 TaxID=933084 RepID=A0A067P827_9AGAM|nr:hypothetical protein JAAARDRAFT_42428 [Jaapia argillacea MUCL 33604]
MPASDDPTELVQITSITYLLESLTLKHNASLRIVVDEKTQMISQEFTRNRPYVGWYLDPPFLLQRHCRVDIQLCEHLPLGVKKIVSNTYFAPDDQPDGILWIAYFGLVLRWGPVTATQPNSHQQFCESLRNLTQS